MQRDKALAHFREHCLDPMLLGKIKDLDCFFRQHKDTLAEEFRESFRQLCDYIITQQETQNKAPIQSIKLSLLRTSLNEGKALCRWDVYDDTGRWECETGYYTYDISWCMQYLAQIIQKLEPIRRKYVLSLVSHDLSRIQQTEIANFYLYVIQLARYTLCNVSNLESMPEFKEIEIECPFSIDVGEFLAAYQPVYLDANHLQPTRNLKTRLKRKPHQCFQSLRESNLSEEQYADINLSYSDVQGSNFSTSIMKQGVYVGTNMQNSNLLGADFSDSYIHDADFSNCCLEQANFSGVKARNGLGENPLYAYQAFTACTQDASLIDENQIPAFFGVCFCGSNLTQTNFINADLRGADFRNAIFKQTCFEQCSLADAIFLQQDQDKLELTSEQMQEIHWV